MAEKIYDNISEIQRAINDLKKSANEASKTTKSLNEDLKLDPSNIELANQRFNALNNELRAYEQYQSKLVQHESDLRSAQQEASNRLSILDKSSSEYKKIEKELQLYSSELTKTERAADSATSQIKRLNAVINGINAKQVAEEAELVKKKLNNVSKSMDALQKAGKKLQIALTLIVTAFTKITKEAISQGTELYTLSTRYKTSAENIQLWNRALQLATGETDLFTQSLQVMSKGLSTIPVGRGVAYNNALKAIGVTYQELQELDPTTQFEKILEGLGNVTDESLRASYAIQLFGNSGQTIASALGKANGEFEQYLEKAKKFSVITSENAKALANMGFELEAVKSKFSVIGAQMIINLYPTIMQLTDLLNNTLVPILVGISQMGWGIYVLVAAIIALKFVPAIVKWAIALHNAKLAQDELNVSMLKGKAIAMGTIGAVTAIFAAIAGIVGASAMAKKYSDSLSDINTSYDGLSSNFNTSLEQVSSQSTERTVVLEVNMHGEGDTEISDEAAQTVAQLTVDELQKRLGDLIK